ncbi:MAG: MFS transporter [Candidatus Bathyarchaeota archaeon]|nr:MFS transporter [Candidatus Bathyarchaeota archaeon]
MMKLSLKARIQDYFGLKRNIVVLSIAIFVLGLGENLWSEYIPKYLEVLGAIPLVVGAYGTLKDFIDAIYMYPGGKISDKFGRKKALVTFSILALVGYVIYYLSPNWFFVLVGLFFVMAWSSLSLPATFALIGDSLPKQRRAIGFTVQSILKRVPAVLAPPIGGFLILQFGILEGVRLGLLITIPLAIFTVLIQMRYYKEEKEKGVKENIDVKHLISKFHPSLKRLLLSDCLIRMCEGIPAVFIILYATNIIGIDTFQFGFLIGIQMATSILVYIPIAKLSDRFGRKPFVTLTFVFFSLYPLFIVVSKDFIWLILAFIIGGLREIGEPPRKAMIVDLAPKEARGSAIGLYYLIRGLTVTPASFIGGLLWLWTPQVPFFTAFLIGIAGTFLFYITVKEKFLPAE